MAPKPLRDLIIYCDRVSDTARELAKRLNARRVRANPNRRLRSTSGGLVINFGTSVAPNFSLGEKAIVLNHPEKVAHAISKRLTFALLKQQHVPHLESTEDRTVAAKWVQEGSGVLCRRDGLSGGKGITFVPKGSQDPLPVTDFYTKYFAKTHEFRAHVFRGRLIDLTQKRLQNGAAKDDSATPEQRLVRSMENGWVHSHQLDVSSAQRTQIEQAAVGAVASLGLDFGAVDILAKPDKRSAQGAFVLAVCEVNSAPGLGNEVTLKAYEDAILAYYTSTRDIRAVVLPPKKRRVKKLVKVWIVTKKGNRVQRERMRWVNA